jgi:hypothetical protein
VQDMMTKSVLVRYIDASTGKVTVTEEIDLEIIDMFLLPNKNQRGANIMVLVDANDNLVILPKNRVLKCQVGNFYNNMKNCISQAWIRNNWH